MQAAGDMGKDRFAWRQDSGPHQKIRRARLHGIQGFSMVLQNGTFADLHVGTSIDSHGLSKQG
jgi:hypothetical protein